MANERNTENIVRKHFSQFSNDIIIEEQQSSNPSINKSLQNASKRGNGKGYPEFIIQYKKNSDFIIVIECKAQTVKHESKSKTQYSDYAVDGVLLYSSYLSHNFDVLSIAVSGEKENSLKISHFLQLKGQKTATQIFDSKLLTCEDYLKAYSVSDLKFREDYKSLLEFTKKLNEELHIYKIAAGQRSLLISCILIALEDEAFLKSYKLHQTPQSLAEYLIHTVTNQLNNANIGSTKLESLKTQYSFIKSDTSLSKKKNILKNIIKDIENNINKFMKTHEYFDVLGQLYLEFLRYANSDKGLGIVLTPPHITSFFANLAQINKNDIVYDNCTGTGGFLIAAMNRMINDAQGDIEKIKSIKSSQLIGTEYQSYIFALAVSNMYIHQDGKTNIFNASCFDKNIIEAVKEKKPTVGLLNPPYQSNKSKDIDEYEFILNNLECLTTGGICIAIIPMQKSLITKGKSLIYKEKLLKQHTLEAVLSMPDELFFNSKATVVSCIMIFTAHKPHPSNKETYFGYYKNDGFIKKKLHGRHDGKRVWNQIQNEWINNYLNKKEIEGLSINRKISFKDEWCAEAYLQTDFNQLTNKHFEKTILEYSSFLFSNQISKNASHSPLIKGKIELNVNDWDTFLLTDLFNIKGSKTTPIDILEEKEEGKFPYVTTQATNNGTANFYNYHTEKGNILTVESAVNGYCSYQLYDFSASDHVEKLIPKFKLNKYRAMFIISVFNCERYKFNYGRKASQTRLKQISIKLPATLDKKPDFDYMEKYIKSLPYSSNLK